MAFAKTTSKTHMENVININFKLLVFRAFKNKSFILILVLPILSLLFNLYQDRVYVASTTLIQQAIFQPSKSSGLLSGNLSSLAEFTGLGSGNTSEEKVSQFEILQSKTFILSFIKSNKLERVIFRKYWDESTNSWKKLSMVSRFKHNIISYFNEGYRIPLSKEPTDYMIYERFMQRHLSISKDKKTNIITLSVFWGTPERAAILCNLLVDQINKHLRKEDIKYISLNLRILEEKYRKVKIEALRLQLSAMIAEQLQKITIAEARSDYAFKIIDPAIPNYKQSSPNYLGAFLATIIFSMIIVLMINFIVIEKSKKQIFLYEEK